MPIFRTPRNSTCETSRLVCPLPKQTSGGSLASNTPSPMSQNLSMSPTEAEFRTINGRKYRFEDGFLKNYSPYGVN